MYIFVYGLLKRNFNLNTVLIKANAKYVGTGRTFPQYTMLDLGPYPGVIEGGMTAIKGEVFDIKKENLHYVDTVEGHPEYYKRKKTEIIPMAPDYLGDPRKVEKNVDCEMYLLNHAVTTVVIESGFWPK